MKLLSKVILLGVIVLLFIACMLAMLYGALLTAVTAWYFSSKLFSALIFVGIAAVVFFIGVFCVALWEVANEGELKKH